MGGGGGFMGGLQDAFGAGEKPLVASDRVTPFDRWMGLDKGLVEADQMRQDVVYVDPADTANYLTVELSKPMGIAFVENEGECGGVYVEELLESGSAREATPSLLPSDQLVAVDGSLVLGWQFDPALDSIKSSTGETTRLIFFRGPTSFLYGPTKPAD